MNDIFYLLVRSDELPISTMNCQATMEIDYRRVNIGGAAVLIPGKSFTGSPGQVFIKARLDSPVAAETRMRYFKPRVILDLPEASWTTILTPKADRLEH